LQLALVFLLPLPRLLIFAQLSGGDVLAWEANPAWVPAAPVLVARAIVSCFVLERTRRAPFALVQQIRVKADGVTEFRVRC
jgi:hypothetical protein